ncbi:hypothetical protein L1987_69556 [Smallanthus sonchifolius]|uniref:Uncharacterized protein n=1 Tax=Smallanthus sonchifolius TaxID=185202 RepID=A0ACB9B835_9ASTR|nr:hypothetical protein L1987_69556 [Smallanthus sonchifolius]
MIQVMDALERALESELSVQVCFIQEKQVGKKEIVHRAGTLDVKVVGITDAGNLNSFDGPDYYLILDISPSGHCPQVVNAERNEVFTLNVTDIHDQVLTIYINKVESPLRYCDTIYDRKFAPLIHHVPNYLCHLTRNEQVVKKHSNVGEAKINLKNFIPAPQSVDTYVFDDCDGITARIKAMTNTHRPMWLQEFTYILKQPPTDENLHFEVINNESKKSIGRFDISLADVVTKKRTCTLEQIRNVDSTIRERLFLQVELQWRTSD